MNVDKDRFSGLCATLEVGPGFIYPLELVIEPAGSVPTCLWCLINYVYLDR